MQYDEHFNLSNRRLKVIDADCVLISKNDSHKTVSAGRLDNDI